MPVPPRRSIIPVLLVLTASLVALPLGLAVRGATGTHLVISEVVTGGASASDELIELYNPTAAPLPLEGLEVVYVSASGASVSRRAAWGAGADSVPAGGHVLLANEAGVYAGIADVLYASGMAASGGSVAIRIQGAGSAIDAVGWGTTTSTWREGTAAVVAASGASVERLPGGNLGSTQDSDDNASDFVERPVPDPQNLGSAPVPGDGPTLVPSPSATASVSPAATAVVTPSVSPTGSPGIGPISVAAARAAADGSAVTIEATALTASDHHDGGGFLADESGGIAVLLDAGSFQRGDLVIVHGTVDDRFSQRTLRANDAEAVVAGGGQSIAAVGVATGAIGEPWEGRLVQVVGAILGAATELSTSLALDLDDGTGPLRVIVPFSSGVDATAWQTGTTLELAGVVGQRDSSGTGAAGYRLMLRGAGDVLAVQPPSQPTPAPSSSAAASPSTTPPDDAEDVVTIAEARAAAKGDRVQVRGVVTMPAGIVDPVTAVIQDATGAIVLRLGDDVGPISPGREIRVSGIRSTKAGMETLRVTDPPIESRAASEPAARALRTGEAGELHEAQLVVVRGALVANARRASSGSVTVEVDDGSGPLRVSLAASLEIDHAPLTAGTWIDVRGVLGQETTGAQPLRGYRVWPRDASDLRITAAPTGADAASGDGADEDGEPAGSSLAGLFMAGGADTRIGATLVAGPWPELGVAGILWDGARVVAIDTASEPQVEAAVAGGPVPVSVELDGPRTVGTEPVSSAPVIALAPGSSGVRIDASRPMPPRSQLPAAGEAPRWVSLVGKLNHARTTLLLPDGRKVALQHRCDAPATGVPRLVGATGIGIGDPATIIVPCAGIRAAPGLVSASTVDEGVAAGTRSDDRLLSNAVRSSPTDRAMPAVLLLTASLLMLGATLARRYLGGFGPPDGPPSDALAGEGQPTLISLVAEHAPERERAAYTPARSTEHEPRRRAPPS